MDDGVVAEYDSVPTLMARATSTFRRMVVEAGLEGSAAASAAASRAASAADLHAVEEQAGEGGEGQPTRPQPLREGMRTFVRRLRSDYGVGE